MTTPTVDELMKQAFSGVRDARSDEYKAGVRAALDCRINKAKVPMPYKVGTASADAYFAGLNEGYSIYATRGTAL